MWGFGIREVLKGAVLKGSIDRGLYGFEDFAVHGRSLKKYPILIL